MGAIIRNLLDRAQIVQTELQVQAQVPQTADLSLDLTSREQQVLVLLTEGLSNAHIGEHLHLSPRTIEKYVSKLLQKTETSNRAEIVRFALDHHLVESGSQEEPEPKLVLPESGNVIDLNKRRTGDQSRK